MPKRVNFDKLGSGLEPGKPGSVIDKLIGYINEHIEKLEADNTLYTTADLRFVLSEFARILILILEHIRRTPTLISTALSLPLDSKEEEKKNEGDGGYFS